MDIWQTASDSRQYLSTGWLGRYPDAQCSKCEKPTQVLEIDDVVSLALKGAQIKGMALKDPRRLYTTSHEKYFRELVSGDQPDPHRPVFPIRNWEKASGTLLH